MDFKFNRQVYPLRLKYFYELKYLYKTLRNRVLPFHLWQGFLDI